MAFVGPLYAVLLAGMVLGIKNFYNLSLFDNSS